MSALYETNSWISMAISLKQQFTGRHVTPLRHIILTLSHPDFSLTTKCFVLSGEASNTYFTVLGITLQGCGNTEMFYLSEGKSSEKSYLSGQNPTCPGFCINIWYLQTQLLNWTCLYLYNNVVLAMTMPI